MNVAAPRFRDPRIALDPAQSAEPYLATAQTTEYAQRDEPGLYVADRVCQTTAHEVVNDGRPSAIGLRDAVLASLAGGADPTPTGLSLSVIGQTHTFYDGDAFIGLPLGNLGDHALATRSETLAFTDAFLDDLYPPRRPARSQPAPRLSDPRACGLARGSDRRGAG